MISIKSTRDAEKIIQVLLEISSALNSAVTLNALYKSIHKSLGRILNVDNIYIALYHKGKDSISFPYYVDETDENFIEIFKISEKQSMVAKVINEKKALRVTFDDLLKMAKKNPGEMIGTLCKVWIGAPLMIRDHAIGVLALQSYSSKDTYDENDLDILISVSEQIAMAIERKASEDALKKNEIINKVLLEVSNAVNTTRNMKQLCKSIHKSLRKVIDVKNFSLSLYDKQADQLNFLYRNDETEPGDVIENASHSASFTYETIRRGEPVLLDEQEQKELARKLSGNMIGILAKSWLCVPLKVNNESIGAMLTQDYTTENCFNQQDIELFTLVSGQIALALDRKRAEDSEKKSQEINRVLFAVSNAVNTTDNLNDLYHSIYGSLNTLIELPNFYIAIVDTKTKSMHSPFYEDQYESEEISSMFVPDIDKRSSITIDVIHSKKPLFLKKNVLKKYADENHIVGVVPVVWLGVPLLIRGQVIGVMAVQHYHDPEYFTEKDMALFVAVSDQVALAIDRKRSQEIILEREKQILQLSEQTQEFSLVAASIISMKDDKGIFKYISKAIVKYSDFQRVLISLFKNEPPFRDIVAYEGIDQETINRVKDVEMPSVWYDAVFAKGEKIGRLTSYIPHTMKHILNQQATLAGKVKVSGKENHWHPDDNLFVEMRGQTGELLGIISVDDSKSGNKPTNETVRPLEIFASLISQIIIFRKIQSELKDHKENLQKMVEERTKALTNEINERIQIEEKLQKAKVAAEEAAKTKGEFLANMSHEIRTPINGIMGMAELAMENDLDDDLRKLVQTIDSEAVALLDIINQILDFSKIEAEKLTLENIPFDLRNTFEKACSLFSMGLKNKEIELISFIAPDIPSRLIGDPGRLRQVILNLAGNAMKFTHEGEIFIKAEKVKQDKSGVEVRFIIKDTGIGIEKSKQKTIFESFIQADGSITRRYGGTGLGTTISKQLVELMGGKIGLESEIGKGSSFWFNIKFKQQKPLTKAEENIDLNGLRILLVDDNATNRFVLIEYLKSFGAVPIVVENNTQGLELIKQSIVDDNRIDALLINRTHSNVDGFEFASKIRQDRAFSNMPIILLTSTGMIGDGQICQEIGIDAYLLKPIKQSELKQAIAASLSNFDVANDSSKLITRHTIAEDLFNRPRVLVVEDYPTNQQIAIRHLQNAGYQAVLAENGKVAVDLFKKQQFDLILMDIQMPVMDGYEATDLIRKYESRMLHIQPSYVDNNDDLEQRVPIIAMTAHAIVGYKEKCLKAGMNYYISKPIRREKFIAVVSQWALKSRKYKYIELKKDPKRIDKNNSRDKEILSEGDPINFYLALDEFENDKEFLLEVVNEFMHRVERQLLKIKKALIEKDAATIEKESHSIKGGAANLTAYDLSIIAHKLEEINLSPIAVMQDFEKSTAIFYKLEKEFLRLKKYVLNFTFD